MPKYLYCVTKELDPDRLATAGIDGASVHVVNWRDLSCVVSDTDSSDKELSKESAMAHEKVLEEVMQKSPIVPIAFGHVAQSEDEVRSKLLEAHQDKLGEYLNYLKGKIELNLKAFWLDLNAVLRNVAETSSEIKRIKAKGRLTRDDQILAGEIATQAMGKVREDAEENVGNFLKDITIEHKKSNLFGEQMIMNLAFLIDESNLDAFDARVNEYEEKLGDNNIKLKYTGPVPPYNFVHLNINLTPRPSEESDRGRT